MKKDTELGLYQKYKVERTDGSSNPGGKHECCEHFVLDLMHDEYALSTLAFYAELCKEKYPVLADDLIKKIESAKSSKKIVI